MHLRHSFERLTMLKFLSLFGLLALTAACANSPTTKQPAAGKCVAEAAQALVGSQGLSTAQIIHTDYENGLIQLAYIDADNETPVLDIKPYTPSLDKVENFTSPQWCRHWPESIEKSGEFNWEEEFNF